MESRGYNPDGAPPSPYAQSSAGDFPMALTPEGYVWIVPTGPGATIRYTATLKDGAWREIGETIAPGRPPTQMFEMNLRRIGDTGWPAAGVVPRQ